MSERPRCGRNSRSESLQINIAGRRESLAAARVSQSFRISRRHRCFWIGLNRPPARRLGVNPDKLVAFMQSGLHAFTKLGRRKIILREFVGVPAASTPIAVQPNPER